MSWTYSGNPADSQKDEVRFWVQDVIQDRQLLSDQEIDYLIDRWYDSIGSIIYVSSVAAEVIAAKCASEVAVSADGVSVNLSELQSKYIQLAARLREQAKLQMDGDIDLPDDAMYDPSFDYALEPLVFGLGFMDNWEVGRSDYGNYRPGGYNPLAPSGGE
jgi:hypothetical protein